MAENYSALFEMTSKREQKLWDSAVFIFDTSSICELYSLAEDAKTSLMTILTKFSDRIWIPAQVMYEYEKNRSKVIMNPIQEAYGTPNDIFKCKLPDHISTFLDRHNKPYYHPFMDKTALDKIKKHQGNVTEIIKDCCMIIKAEYDKRKTEILAVKENDSILKAYKNFPSGDAFTTEEVFQMIPEAEMRYKHKIPPGYEDESTKIGTQIYGDFIVWKEVLRYAKEYNKPVIFICNDVKIDWYNKHDKAPESPRHELIKEFFDCTGADFWMYTIRQFIKKLEQIYSDPTLLPLFSGLESALLILEKSEREALRITTGQTLIVKCNRCKNEFEIDRGEFDFEWESAGVSERGMGTEREYTSEDHFDCPHCGNDMVLTFRVREYPAGAFNYSSIDCDEGEVLKEFSLENVIDDMAERAHPCVICGCEIISEYEHCEECLERIRVKTAADD